MMRPSRTLVIVPAAVLLIATLAAQPQRQPAASESPCDIRTSERVVAVGDVHGAYDQFASILRAAGIIDRRDRWSGGRAVFIQTGDVLDRGPDSRKALDLLQRLEREAVRAGGRVYALLGNHEFMRLIGDWRYVSAGEYAAFTTGDSEDFRQRAFVALEEAAAKRARSENREHDAAAYREQFMREVPLGWLEMRLQFEPTAAYGKWVRSRPALVRVNGTVFLHGGISDTTAALGCAGINDTVARELAAAPQPPEQLNSLFSISETGPLWYRGLANEPEAKLSPILDTILERMQARAIVIGHTVTMTGRIATRFGGRVVQIDTGMLDGEFFPGGVPSALELQGDMRTAIYLDRREPLPPTPAPAAEKTAAQQN